MGEIETAWKFDEAKEASKKITKMKTEAAAPKAIKQASATTARPATIFAEQASSKSAKVGRQLCTEEGGEMRKKHKTTTQLYCNVVGRRPAHLMTAPVRTLGLAELGDVGASCAASMPTSVASMPTSVASMHMSACLHTSKSSRTKPRQLQDVTVLLDSPALLADIKQDSPALLAGRSPGTEEDSYTLVSPPSNAHELRTPTLTCCASECSISMSDSSPSNLAATAATASPVFSFSASDASGAVGSSFCVGGTCRTCCFGSGGRPCLAGYAEPCLGGSSQSCCSGGVGCVRVAGSISGHDDETEMITSSSCTSAYEVLDVVGALGTTSWGAVNDTIARRKEDEHGSWRVAGKDGKRRLQFVTREGECHRDRGLLKQVQSREILQQIQSRLSLLVSLFLVSLFL